ncbi:hypothetical protein BDV38DRAFT_276106 [Aspergillus pseudotamarii]|uniref:Uncharacterized protein n=1 Tax=Aspergillus pseudotamarii TaxID=132259 RepID=A0A5N6S996_ASPPS|nr:uncharacterized protein BDV38DRAFT_276106 [Aspergillus pseudotamarii]KAE8131266.1 hypothetical protein BDV38DRAFT_276106 [Aspergillus pseudotamarii]
MAIRSALSKVSDLASSHLNIHSDAEPQAISIYHLINTPNAIRESKGIFIPAYLYCFHPTGPKESVSRYYTIEHRHSDIAIEDCADNTCVLDIEEILLWRNWRVSYGRLTGNRRVTIHISVMIPD